MLVSSLTKHGIHAVRSTIARQSVLLSTAGALTAGNLITAMLGFVYWWLAARCFAPSEVGFAAGAVSIMNLLAQIGEFGMGPLLISELPGRARTAGGFVSAALAATLASGSILAIACLALGHIFSIRLGGIADSPSGNGVFLVGVAMTCFTVVLDQAFVGLLRAGFQLVRTVSFALLKLLFLIAAVFIATGPSREEAIFETWIAGHLLSLCVLVLVLARGGHRIWHIPRFGLLRPMIGRVVEHHALNVAIQAPALMLPFVVTVLLSPQTNAAFYAAWTLVNVIMLVPASLSSVVVSVARREPHLLGRRLGFSLTLSCTIAVAASVGCLAFSTFILGLFSPRYPAIASSSLALLGFGTIGMTIKYHYIALERFANRMLVAAVALAAGGCLEVGAATFGARRGGLDGFTLGWLIAVTLEALFMAPALVTVIRFGQKSPPERCEAKLSLTSSGATGVHADAST